MLWKCGLPTVFPNSTAFPGYASTRHRGTSRRLCRRARDAHSQETRKRESLSPFPPPYLLKTFTKAKNAFDLEALSCIIIAHRRHQDKLGARVIVVITVVVRGVEGDRYLPWRTRPGGEPCPIGGYYKTVYGIVLHWVVISPVGNRKAVLIPV